MSRESDNESNEAAGETGDTVSPVPWLRATAADVQALDFEAPIKGVTAAEANVLGDHFRAATPAEDTPSNRVFSTLAAVTGMQFRPEEPQEPFVPLAVFADGRRTAIPSDFFGEHVNLLAEIADRCTNVVLKARLSDVCWLLDRKRGDMGRLAVSTYVELVHQVDSGALKFGYDDETGVLEHAVADYLRRALQIGRAIGWDKAETLAAREAAQEVRGRAVKMRALVPVLWLAELDLDFGLSDPAAVGAEIDELLKALPDDAHSHIVVELWRLAARAYHYAKREDDASRCQSEAAERLVSDAETSLSKGGSAILAAHQIASAIAQLHGIPGKKDRRTSLRHRLVDVQAGIPDELSPFFQKMDLEEIVKRVEVRIERLGLTDKLFMIAALIQSPEPKQLMERAREAIKKHPMSSLFGASHLDSEGKFIHRSEGAGPGDSASNSALQKQIAQDESIRRTHAAHGQIEPARQAIITQHFLSEEMLLALLEHSPFVPADLVGTFSRGFARFFQGDFVGALYILTPLLENSLRHVLRQYGHDVTTFDDATQTQEDRTISSLFEQMRAELNAVFSEAIVADIDNVFLAKPGPHLRHSLAHGLLHDGSPYGADAIYACGLMFRLCLLPLFPHRKELQPLFD